MYTGTYELYNDETDTLRVFTGECEPYNEGGMAGTPRYSWIMELTGPISELDESGNVIGQLPYRDPLHDEVRKGIEASALEAFNSREPSF
jgi:hypothetical protein